MSLEAFLTYTFWFLAGIVGLIFLYYKWTFNYWKSRGVPTLDPKIPMGDAQSPLFRERHLSEHYKHLYDTLKKRGHRHGGLYIATSKVYMPVDPELIKHILSKDFQHFVERGLFDSSPDQEPILQHLFNVGGSRWKTMRQKLTPTFSSGKMKQMLGTVLECGNDLNESMRRSLAEGQSDVLIKDYLASYTMDIIGSCAFGLDFNAIKDPESPFRKQARKLTDPTMKTTINQFFRSTWPNLSRILGVTLDKEITDFFMDLVKDTVNYRETGVTRNDFMQLLVNLKNATEGLKISIDDIAANTFLFFLAGFETSSTAMSYCLLELSRNPHVQTRVRKEIRDVLKKHGGDLTYDGIKEMKYLGQVFDETLRLYPSLPILNRVCTIDWNVPGTDVVIERGTPVIITATGIQRDPEFFEEPDRFDPERFSEENISKIRPFTYLPFGDGPRNCIGLRFGLMQSKVGLASLLKDFEFSLSDRTQVPIKCNPNGFFTSVKGGLWLNVKRVE